VPYEAPGAPLAHIPCFRVLFCPLIYLLSVVGLTVFPPSSHFTYMHDLSYEHLIIPYILRVLQHMILPRFSLLLFPPLVEVVFCWKHLESLILKPKGRTAKGGSSADGGSRSGLGLHLKLRLKCDGAVYKQPRTHVCFTQSDDAPQPFRSLSRFCPFSAFVSVLFRSGLSFIVLLQSCLRRFMLAI